MVNIHIAFVVLTLCLVFYSDHKAFLWFRGKIVRMDSVKTNICHKLGLWGFLLICTTGFSLFWPLREFLLSNNVFLSKMIFVSVLGINGLFIGKLSPLAINNSYFDLSSKEKTVLFVSAMCSSLGWVCTIVLAYLIF